MILPASSKNLFKLQAYLPKVALSLADLIILADVFGFFAVRVNPPKWLYTAMLINKIHNGLDNGGIIACLATTPISAFVVDAMADTLGIAIAELRLNDSMLGVR